MSSISTYFSSSIGRKQIVAVTGLLLIGFIIGHLAGNLLIFLGPEAFNNYAKKLANLRPGLYAVEAGLLLIFIIHMWLTATLVWENIKSRPTLYKSTKAKGQRSFATRIMPYTGSIILAFVIWHLFDFTFVDKYGSRSYLSNGQSYGLFGIVYNSFRDPTHSFLYIIAMMSLAFHLSHGIQSFAQTFGFHGPELTPKVKKISNLIAFAIGLSYSLIPISILFQWMKY